MEDINITAIDISPKDINISVTDIPLQKIEVEDMGLFTKYCAVCGRKIEKGNDIVRFGKGVK